MSDTLRQMQGAGTIGPVPVVYTGMSMESLLIARLGLPPDCPTADILERCEVVLDGYSEQSRQAKARNGQIEHLKVELDLAHAELERHQAGDQMVDEGSPANDTDPKGPPTAELVAQLRAELAGAQRYANDTVREMYAGHDQVKELARSVESQVSGVRPVWVRGPTGNVAGYNVFLPVALTDTLLAALQEAVLPVDPPANPV